MMNRHLQQPLQKSIRLSLANWAFQRSAAAVPAAPGGVRTGAPGAAVVNPAPAESGRLTVARVAWIGTAMLSLTLFLTSIPPRYTQLAHSSPALQQALADLGLPSGFYAAYTVGLELLLALVFQTVGVIVFVRKSHDATAIVTSFMLLLAGSAMRPIVTMMDALLAEDPSWTPVVRVLTYLTWTFVVAFFCVFPDGRFVPRWTVGLLLFAALIFIPWDLFPDSPLSPLTWPPLPFIAVELVLWGGCALAQLMRYRQASQRTARQQTRWVVYGGTITLGGGLLLYLARALNPQAIQAGSGSALIYDLATLTGMYLAVLATPLAIGISILRYRLWGIDMLINRTLVYVPLTAILAGVYSAATTLLQKTFIAVTGNQSDAAVVITTLILVTTFTPIKNALQSIVDRWFKEAPDPARLLRAFRAEVDAEVAVIDPYRVTPRLLDEAVAAFEATGGAVFLGPAGQETLVHAQGELPGAGAISLPLETAGVRLGRLVLGPRRNELDYTAQDRANLETTVQRVADAIGIGNPLMAEAAPEPVALKP